MDGRCANAGERPHSIRETNATLQTIVRAPFLSRPTSQFVVDGTGFPLGLRASRDGLLSTKRRKPSRGAKEKETARATTSARPRDVDAVERLDEPALGEPSL